MSRYDRLSERIRAIAERPGARLHCLGEVDDLPFWRIDLIPPAPRWQVCLAAGIHGDEPAGVEALLRFLEAPPDLPVLWSGFPCMNPTGLTRGTREDRHGRDLNRCFVVDSEGPVRMFQDSVGAERWDLYVDLHEDDRTTGFYAFEIVTPHPPLGPGVIRTLRANGLPIEPVGSLERLMAEEDLPFGPTSQDGLVVVPTAYIHPEDMAQGPWMIGPRADRGLTFETPSRAAWETRIVMHQTALMAALEEALASG